MSEPTEREWLEGLRYEDKFPVPADHGTPNTDTNERDPMDTMTVRLTLDPQGEPAPELPDIAMHLRAHLEGSAIYRDGTYVVAVIEGVEVLD